MPLNSDTTGIRVTAAALVAAFVLVLTFAAPHAGAQTAPAEPKPDAETYQILYLTNITDQRDANDVLTDLRNMLPRARVYYVTAQNAISMRGTPEDIQQAQKILADLDRPRKLYRLTYTITDFDNGKRVGSQHFVILAVSGQKSTFRQGSRVPIVTGTTEAQTQSSQVQYADVGLSIEASVSGSPDGLDLRTKVEQSSLSDEKSGVGAQDPVIRQTILDESSELAQGKPLVLGSLDILGTTRRQEVEVVAELVN